MPALGSSRASIRIYGPDVDPARVTALLGCPPDGEPVQHSTRGRLWSIRSEKSTPADLDTQITALLARATDDLDAWRRAGEGHRVDAFCGLFMNEWNEGLSLAPATLLALAQRGITLDLDLYGASWDERTKP